MLMHAATLSSVSRRMLLDKMNDNMSCRRRMSERMSRRPRGDFLAYRTGPCRDRAWRSSSARYLISAVTAPRISLFFSPYTSKQERIINRLFPILRGLAGHIGVRERSRGICRRPWPSPMRVVAGKPHTVCLIFIRQLRGPR